MMVTPWRITAALLVLMGISLVVAASRGSPFL
jgi:hypothetical protein